MLVSTKTRYSKKYQIVIAKNKSQNDEIQKSHEEEYNQYDFKVPTIDEYIEMLTKRNINELTKKRAARILKCCVNTNKNNDALCNECGFVSLEEERKHNVMCEKILSNYLKIRELKKELYKLTKLHKKIQINTQEQVMDQKNGNEDKITDLKNKISDILSENI